MKFPMRRSRIWILALPIFCLPNGSFARTLEGKLHTCPGLLRGEAQNIVAGRKAGQQVQAEFLKDQLLKLSGRLPLVSTDCITDRCTLPNRVEVRKYILSQLETFGVLPEQIAIETRGPDVKKVALTKQKPRRKKERKKRRKLFGLFGGSPDGKPLEPEAEVEYKDIPIPEVERDLVNIVVTIPGSKYPNEVLEVSAHYDTAGNGVPGADDNGSGLITAIATVKALNALKPERTVRVIFADLEERGFQGTLHHIQLLKQKPQTETFLGAIVVDQIGYFPKHRTEKKKFVVEVGEQYQHSSDESYQKTKDLANAVVDQMKAYERLAEPSIALSNALPGTADHGPYWKANLPAVLVAAFYEGDYLNPGYHSPRDTIEQIDWDFLAPICTQVVEAVGRIAGQPATAEEIAQWNPLPNLFAETRDHVETQRQARRSYGYDYGYQREYEKTPSYTVSKPKEKEPVASTPIAVPNPIGHGPELDWNLENIVRNVERLPLQLTSVEQWRTLLRLQPRGDRPIAKLRLTTVLNLHLVEASESQKHYLRSSVEVFYKSNYHYGDSKMKIRFGEYVFAIRDNELQARTFSPSDFEGYDSIVFYSTRPEVDLMLWRFAHYVNFQDRYGAFNARWGRSTYVPMSGGFTFNDTGHAFALKELGEGTSRRVWMEHFKTGFRNAIRAGEPFSLSVGHEARIVPNPAAFYTFGPDVLRDVMGLNIHMGCEETFLWDRLQEGLVGDYWRAKAEYRAKPKPIFQSKPDFID